MAYKERKNSAVASAEQDLGGHIIRDGLVRSFRFNSLGTNTRYKVNRQGQYPFARHEPKEVASYFNQGFYAFTLTWTPGQMVITGDCGDLTLTHYNAMGDFEEAISWALHSDFDYLLGKSNARREYVQEETWKWFKDHLNEEVFNALLGSYSWSEKKRNPKYSQRAELRAWRRSKPKWNKRVGQIKAEFLEELDWWKDDRPEDIFRTPDCDVWDRWNQLRKALSFYEEQYSVTKSEDRHQLLYEAEQEFHSEEAALNFLYGKMEMDDPHVCQDYPWRSYYLIACIQHGCRMIQKQLNLKEVA